MVSFLCVVSAPVAHADRWAVVIGIDEYKDSAHIPPVRGAADDARQIARALVQADAFPANNVHLLVPDTLGNRAGTEAKPDESEIGQEIDRLERKCQPGDTVFLYFSGQIVDRDGKSYLLPWDAQTYDDGTLIASAIDIKELENQLGALKAALLIVVCDAGRNAVVTTTVESADRSAKTPSRTRTLFAGTGAPAAGAPAIVTLASCGADEQSYCSKDKGRGYFGVFLEQGLRGAREAAGADGVVTIDSLASFVAKNVGATVKEHEGKVQTPFRTLATGAADSLRTPICRLGADPAPVVAAAPPVAAADPHGYLRLKLNPHNAELFVDGVRTYPVAGRIAVDTGDKDTRDVEIYVSAEGFRSQCYLVTVQRGTIAPVTVALVPAPPDPPAPGAAGGAGQ